MSGAVGISPIPICIMFLNYNFGKEQWGLTEDNCMIEACRSVLNVLM